jgi:hypothetical protein
MRAIYIAVLITALSAISAFAEEPVGCDKFKWPVEREMGALRTPNMQQVKSGTKVAAIPFVGTLLLIQSGSANLPKAPEREPKDDTFSGYLAVTDLKPGAYSISLSDVAWVDVVEHDHFLKAKAHSGVQGCEGIRKVLQFELKGAIVIQISGAPTLHLNVAVLPAGWP